MKESAGKIVGSTVRTPTVQSTQNDRWSGGQGRLPSRPNCKGPL